MCVCVCVCAGDSCSEGVLGVMCVHVCVCVQVTAVVRVC